MELEAQTLKENEKGEATATCCPRGVEGQLQGPSPHVGRANRGAIAAVHSGVPPQDLIFFFIYFHNPGAWKEGTFEGGLWILLTGQV